jgi:hypothetical protein
VVRNDAGEVTRDARKIIFPGSNGDPWWDAAQLLEQMKDAISIFEEAYPGCEAVFIFDQSSAHASLPPDAIRPFDMNKSNGGKQRVQHDTIIPSTGQLQKMTTDSGEAKGLKQVLDERGFNTALYKRAKCTPVCPFESKDCCLARLLSQQKDVTDQTSMLENLIVSAGHHCVFLPKFHCELNPIEMVCFPLLDYQTLLTAIS